MNTTTETATATTNNPQAIQRFTYAEWEQLPDFAQERLAHLAPILPPIPKIGDPTAYIYADEGGQPYLLAYRVEHDVQWPIRTRIWSLATHTWSESEQWERVDSFQRKVADLQLWNPQTPLASTEPSPAAEPAA